MLRKYKKIVLALLFMGIVFLSNQSLVMADGLNFTVQPILPENQVNKSKPYFDLRVNPNEQQTIEVELTNVVDHDITVLMRTTTAITNSNGVIEYKDLNPELDSTLKYPFAELAQMPESIVLGPNATQRVPITITVPPEEFDGMILGGLYFKEETYDEEEDTQGGMGVINTFSYIIGVKLTENDNPIKPDLVLLGAKAGQVNYHNAIEVNLQNPQPVEMNNLALTVKIYKKGDRSTALYQEERLGLRMAPNSNFYFPVSMGAKAYKAGLYTAVVDASTDDQKWNFEKDFEITKDEANALNNESVEDLDYPFNYLLWGGVALGVILLLFIIGILVAKSKINKAKQEVLKKKKQSKKKSSSKRVPKKR